MMTTTMKMMMIKDFYESISIFIFYPTGIFLSKHLNVFKKYNTGWFILKKKTSLVNVAESEQSVV